MVRARNPIQLLLGLFGFEPSLPSPQPPLRPSIRSLPAPVLPPSGAHLPETVHLEGVRLEYLPRLRKTWRLVRRQGEWICELPALFREAPLEIQRDLGLWIRCALRPFPGSRAQKKMAQRRVFTWMAPHVRESIPKSEAQGAVWNLQDRFDELNRSYFQGTLEAIVRWSPKIGGLSTHRKIEVNGMNHHVLTISRAYDGAQVPQEAVEGVLFHEMCHIAFPPREGSAGRRRHVHHRAFREAEQRYAGFEAWREWERTHLHRELRRRRKGLS